MVSTVLLKYLVFPLLTICWKISSPFLSHVFPINKEVVHVIPGSGVTIDPKTQYPIFDFIGLVEGHGYNAEAHKVITKDGYILTVHRISGGPGNPKAPGKPAVFIQHGMGMTSDSYAILGPKNDLSYLLVNAGYDVWIGNGRGSVYSRGHVWKDPDSKSYWEHSWYEMGIYDLPAVIDTILNKTGQEKLTYFGHSMGNTQVYVLLSMLPEYNDKINMLYSVAPATAFRYSLQKVVSLLYHSRHFMKALFDYYEWYGLFPQSALAIDIGKKFCSADSKFQPVCAKLYSNVGLDTSRINKVTFPDMFATFPVGWSRYTLFHFFQNMDRKTYMAYDYGNDTMNLEKYGQKEAPVFDLTKVTAPVSIWYTETDDWVNPKDVLDLANTLPNLVSLNKMHVDWKFNHVDFIWSDYSKELFFDKLPLFHKNSTNFE